MTILQKIMGLKEFFEKKSSQKAKIKVIKIEDFTQNDTQWIAVFCVTLKEKMCLALQKSVSLLVLRYL